MKIILATHNKNKIKEINDFLRNTNLDLVSLEDLNDYDEIIEDGNSFFENALIKAKTIAHKYNLPVLADDSGLEIEALNNEPGINSSRYSGKGDYYNNLKVLEGLKDAFNRRAKFTTIIVLYYPNGDYESFKGEWEGFINTEIKGINGFGYDPIFIPKGYQKTVAEMNLNIKNKESHRAKALSKLKSYLVR